MIMPAHFRRDMAGGIRFVTNRNYTDVESARLVASLMVSVDAYGGKWTVTLTCAFPGGRRLYGHLCRRYLQPGTDSA